MKSPLLLPVLALVLTPVVTPASTMAEDAADFFPGEITYKIRKNALAGGSFHLKLTEDLNSGDRLQITLNNFEAIGMGSDERFMSFIYKDSLALYGHVVLDGEGRQVRSVFFDPKCESAFGQAETNCFKYREGEGANPLQTEIFAPHPAIDLISSLIVASSVVASGDHERPLNFNFIINKTTKQVTLQYEETVTIETPLGKQKAVVLSLRHKNTGAEFYRFFIGTEAEGTFPLKMLFVEDDGGKLEFIADEVRR